MAVTDPSGKLGCKGKLSNLPVLLMLASRQSAGSSVLPWLRGARHPGNCSLNTEKLLSVFEDVIDQLSLENSLSLYYFSYILK